MYIVRHLINKQITTPRWRRKIKGKPTGPTRYVPYVKRYGKFIPVGKPTTLKKAKTKGIGVLKGTLAATLEIRETKTGKAIPIAKETFKFRPGKKG